MHDSQLIGNSLQQISQHVPQQAIEKPQPFQPYAGRLCALVPAEHRKLAVPFGQTGSVWGSRGGVRISDQPRLDEIHEACPVNFRVDSLIHVWVSNPDPGMRPELLVIVKPSIVSRILFVWTWLVWHPYLF